MKYPCLLLSVFLFLGCGPDEEKKYHVYYHGNGSTNGSAPKDPNNYFSGDIVTILGKGNLAKGDYDFYGWRYYDTFYFPGDNITVHYDDLNLYAVWDDGLNTPYSYKIENGEAIITRYNEQNTSFVVIPDTLQSKPVVAIDDNVFGNLYISSISLPKKLKHIGIGAFASNNITQVIIPDTVTYIGLGAFRGNRLKKVTLGTGISTIAPYTFGNNQLAEVTIPENVTSIGRGAFHENNIEMVKLGANVDIKDDTSMGTYGGSFLTYYNREKKAGLYIYVGGDAWELY